MKVTDQLIPLISDIEEKIGSSCYNGESYNGWTGDYGCDFRYPIVYEIKDGDNYQRQKTKQTISSIGNINAENILTVCYKFGANELSIGKAVIDILNMLEARFDIDIETLEKKHQEMMEGIRAKFAEVTRTGKAVPLNEDEARYLSKINPFRSTE